MNRATAISGAFLLAAVTLTGCSTGSSSPDAEPSSSPTASSTVDDGTEPTSEPQACKEECSNMEVAESGCDIGRKSNAAAPFQVAPGKLDGIEGNLELRRADPTVCEDLYWARFRPFASASANWVVDIQVAGMPYEDQASDQGPDVVGYTEGVYALPGTDITYCVTQAKGDGTDKVCQTVAAGKAG